MIKAATGSFGVALGKADGRATVSLSGDWSLKRGLPDAADVVRQIEAAGSRNVTVDARDLGAWGDALVVYVMALQEACDSRKLTLDLGGLPEGARSLVDLALAVPERAGARRTEERTPFLEAVGKATQRELKDAGEIVTFLGDATLMFGRFLRGKAVYRKRDLWLTIQECGADALPIVTIIALLIGMILGFVGAVQLQQFGAGIFVADLVAIAQLREMGAIMTGIVLAGRTGAAFAAQIGTMQGNEEIDSLQTFGIPPIDFLVLPRMLALLLMMPLLVVYANVVGIIGGWMVGASILDLDTVQYFERTREAAGLTDLALGVFKGVIFGAIVATAGCLRGLQCGRSAASVGIAATSAVVTSIVYIIVTDGVFAVITNILGI